MVRIKLRRSGPRNKPFYKIVAVDSRSKMTAKPLETIGYWHPKKEILKIDKEKIKEWLKKGASVSKAVENLAAKTK